LKSGQLDHAALLLMGVTVLIWAFNWIVMKEMARYVGPFDLVFLRFLFAFPLLFLMLLASRQKLKFPPFRLTVLIALFQMAAFACLSQFALIDGGAGHVVMLTYTMPFWVVLLAWLLLGYRPTRRHVIGFVLAAFGLLAVIAPWQGLGTLRSSILAIGGGFCWALGTVFSQMLFQRHRVNVLNLTAWQMFLGALFTLPFALVVPQQALEWRPEVIWGLAYMAVMASAAGWGLWLLVVRRVSATIAGLSSLGVPVLAVILAWILLAERPTALELVGIVLMMAGLVVVNWSSSAPGRVRRSGV
jgi:Predicted permease, DMT superfamily